MNPITKKIKEIKNIYKKSDVKWKKILVERKTRFWFFILFFSSFRWQTKVGLLVWLLNLHSLLSQTRDFGHKPLICRASEHRHVLVFEKINIRPYSSATNGVFPTTRLVFLFNHSYTRSRDCKRPCLANAAGRSRKRSHRSFFRRAGTQ